MTNTLNLVRYGRYTSGAPESDTGLIASGASRACVFDALTKNVWWTKGGFVGGKVSGDVSARMSIYQDTGSNEPDDLVIYMENVTVSTVMVGGGDGTHYTANISGGPAQGYAGTKYAIDIIAGGGAMRHSMIAAASIPSATNKLFFNRSAPSNPPPQVYGSYTSSIEGHLTAYLEGWENNQPQTPLHLTPSGTVTDTAPTFTMTFRDLNGGYGTSSGNGVDTGDSCNQYQIQVRQVGTTTLLWNSTYSATSTEKSTDTLTRAYGGSTLTRGVTYEWRARTSDQFSAWGSWSGWESFTPASLGYVTLDSDPTGKLEAITGIDFKGRWNHQSSADMTRVQVRLLNQNGTVLQTGADYNIADVASAALPGTLFTVTWANTGFSDLAWGRSYQYQIRGKDSTTWSDWSAARSFTTNAAPTNASAHSPVTGTIVTDYPLLAFSATDSDDTVAGGLAGYVYIIEPDLTPHEVSATYNATSGKWEYQVTSSEFTGYGVHTWYGYLYDGTLYSGETASAAAARAAGTALTIDYESGPTVTVSSPADLATITTASLTVSWSVSGGTQAKYQILVYADGTSTIVYDSGLLTSTATSHEIPGGYLRNNTSYDLVVQVTDTTPLVGYSSIVNIAVAFTPPDAIANFQATPVQIGLDPFATAIRLSFEKTAYAEPDFVDIPITRSASGGPDADEIILARLSSPGDVYLIDYTPASGYQYTYGASVSIRIGADVVTSDPVYATASITLEGTVLSLVTNGGTYRACLLNAREVGHSRAVDEAVYQSPAETRPVTVRSVARVWSTTIEAAMFGDDDATAKVRIDELDDLDAQDGTICFRNARQIKRFCKMVAFDPAQQIPDWWSVAIGLREERYSEGES